MDQAQKLMKFFPPTHFLQPLSDQPFQKDGEDSKVSTFPSTVTDSLDNFNQSRMLRWIPSNIG